MSKNKSYTRAEIDSLALRRRIVGKPPRKYLIYGDIFKKPEQWYFISDMPNKLLIQAVNESIYLPAAHRTEIMKEMCRRLEKLDK